MEVLDYHKLKIFKTVADVKSFSKAADLLFLTQPTVTQQIKKIENYLGLTLFIRKKDGVFLTKEGMLFYQQVKKILESYEELEEKLANLKKSNIKSLFMGASSTVGEYFLPKFINGFYNLNSGIKINLFIGNSKEIEDGILSKTFHIGFVEDEITSNKFDKVKIFEDEIILIASVKSEINNCIKLTDLEKYPIIFREKGSGTRNIVQRYLKKHNININPVMEISSSRAIANIVENSRFLAFVSKLVVDDMLNAKRLKKIVIDELSIKRNFYYITQKNVNLPFLDRNFLLYLNKILK